MAAVLAEAGAVQSGGDYLVPNPESPRDLIAFQSLYGEDSPQARAFERDLAAARNQDVQIAGEFFTRVGDLNAPSVAVTPALWPQLRANAFYHSKWGNLVPQPIVAQLAQESYRYGYGGSRLNDFMKALTVAVVAVGGAFVVGGGIVASAAAEGATISAIEGGAVIAAEEGAALALPAAETGAFDMGLFTAADVGLAPIEAGATLALPVAETGAFDMGLFTAADVGLAPVEAGVLGSLPGTLTTVQAALSPALAVGRAVASMFGGEGGEVLPPTDASASERARLGVARAVGFALFGFVLYKLARA